MSALSPSIHKIQIHCFQKFALFINDRYIYIANKKAGELLAYLICAKSVVSKVKLAENLWPDVSAEKAMNSLYKACQFVKSMDLQGMGLPLEIYRNDLFLDTDSIYSDTAAFERLYAGSDDIHMCEQAVALYTGPLFYENCYGWSAIDEAYYDIRYLSLVEQLIAHYTRANNPDMVAYYQSKLQM